MGFPFVLCALLAPVVAVYEVTVAGEVELIQSFEDDAFYYFRIARNIAQGLGSTFDGLEPTSGYHPLWLLILVPVYVVTDQELTALILIKALSCTSWVVSISILYAIARRLNALVAFMPSLILAPFLRAMWFNGMETTILLPALLAVVLASIPLFDRQPRTADFLRCGLVLAAVVLARLDTVFLLPAFAVVAGGGMPSLRGQRGGGVRLMALMGPAVLCLGAYVLMNWIAFDTWSPVSGQAKAFGPAFDNFSVLTGYLTWHPVPAPLLGGLETWHYLLLVLLTVTLTMVYLRTPAIGVLGRFVVSFVAANVMQVAYYASATSYPLWNWYYYYSPVILLLWLPLFALAVSYSFRSRVALPVTVLTCLLLTTVLARNLRYVHSGRPEVFDYQAASVAASKWLESRTPRSAVVAMGDRAGSFAYLLDRPVLQLEGLVNSTEYLEVLRDGRILTYMAGAGVDYYVRSGGATSGGWPRLLDLDDPAGPCSAVSEPKFGTVPRAEVVVCEGDRVYHKEIEEFDSESGFFSIWRYRPELNNESP